jgi:hypothetical protein
MEDEMSHGKFGAVINCMDGRVQEPVARWLKKRYQLDYVDTITEPGPDHILAQGDAAQQASILARLRISVEKHGARVVAVAGHDDCAGNPVSPAEHWVHIRRAVETVRGWGLPVEVIALWVDSQWQVFDLNERA